MLKKTSTSPEVDDLLRILEISRHQAMTTDLQSLLAEIESAASDILNCERATVFVYDGDREELYSCVTSRSEFVHTPADQGIAAASFQSGLLLNIKDAYRDSRFNPSVDLETGFKTRNMLVCPLTRSNNEILGVIEALNKHQGEFNSRDELLLETFAAQSAISLHRQFLMEEYGEKKRIQSELAIAKQIQQELLPKTSPEIKSFDIAGWNQPAEETSGDFYDFQLLNNGNFLFIIADVAGHGVGPALLAAQCSAFQRAVFSMGYSIEKSLTKINELLCKDIPNDRFATVFLGILNPDQNEIRTISAGHGPVCIYRADTQTVRTLEVDGMPLGIMKDNTYDQWQRIQFEADDILIALTDGFIEGEDLASKPFGIERISEVIKSSCALEARNIVLSLQTALMSHIAGTRQSDDLTAIVIKRIRQAE